MSGHEGKTCPIWVGYLLLNPLRNLYQSPKKILGPFIRAGMIVLDFGCAMGFFTLPLARMVGAGGKVIAVDIREKMLKTLEARARKAGLSDRIETHLADADALRLDRYEGKIDFILAFAVIHEVPEISRTFTEFHHLLKPEGKLLVAEPKGHVSGEDFKASLLTAERCGFVMENTPKISRSHAVLLSKKTTTT